MERLGWPPAQGKGPGSGQTKKRSGAADLEIQQGSFTGEAKSCRVWRRSLSRGSQSRQVLATGGNSLAVMAADSMLRRDHKAQAGNQRLHGQADFGAESESVPFEASSFKGNQTAQSRRRGDGLQTFWLLGAAQTWWYNFTHTATFSAQNRSSNTESVLRGLCDLLICCPLNVI